MGLVGLLIGWLCVLMGGGGGVAAARELYRRIDIADSLESIFALANMDGNGKLGFAEFLLHVPAQGDHATQAPHPPRLAHT